jgi:hypothetical protein
VSLGKLTVLQERVLVLAASVRPRWTLTGGGALAGFHTKHRGTRDLDLFFRGERLLGDRVQEVRDALANGGLDATVLRTSPMFTQLDVRDGDGSVVVDLVADPTPIVEQPEPVVVGEAEILIETRHQILVNKLCALLSRSELRDLVDVRALVEAGEDLVRALADAPNQDAGFSPLTFSWSVRSLAVRKLATALGWSDEETSSLEQYRDALVERVLADARPTT